MERQAWVDFNETDDDDHVYTLLKHVAPDVQVAPGVRLLVGDRSGNVCQAYVVSVEGQVVDLALDAGTFQAAPADTGRLLTPA